MPPTWDDALLTGVDEIDAEHRELLIRINRFFDACDRGKGREEIKEVFDFLQDYIESHFATEEKYMLRYSYPDYAAHRQLHTDFRRDFAELKKKFDDAFHDLSTLKELRVQVETNWLLGQWWVDHIDKVDKALGIFLKAKVKG